jgi:hypothetical protein
MKTNTQFRSVASIGTLLFGAFLLFSLSSVTAANFPPNKFGITPKNIQERGATNSAFQRWGDDTARQDTIRFVSQLPVWGLSTNLPPDMRSVVGASANGATLYLTNRSHFVAIYGGALRELIVDTAIATNSSGLGISKEFLDIAGKFDAATLEAIVKSTALKQGVPQYYLLFSTPVTSITSSADGLSEASIKLTKGRGLVMETVLRRGTDGYWRFTKYIDNSPYRGGLTYQDIIERFFSDGKR